MNDGTTAGVTSASGLARAAEAARTLVEALSADATQPGCHLFLRLRLATSNPQRWLRLKFANGLATTLRARLAEEICSRLAEADDLVPFAHEYLPLEKVAFIGKEEVPILKDWIDDLPSPDWPHIFNGNPEVAGKIQYQATSVEVSEDCSVLKIYSRRSASALLTRGNIITQITSPQEQFQEITGKVYEFSTTPDFVEWKGTIFIFNIQAFENLTGLRSVILKKAQDALAGVRDIEGLIIDELGAVNALLDASPRLARQLAAAHTQGTIKALKTATLVARLKEMNLDIEVVPEGDAMRFRVDPSNKGHVRDLIDLLTDTRLRSTVTGFEWRVYAKARAE